jgi:hypothetical protein
MPAAAAAWLMLCRQRCLCLDRTRQVCIHQPVIQTLSCVAQASMTQPKVNTEKCCICLLQRMLHVTGVVKMLLSQQGRLCMPASDTNIERYAVQD